MKYFLTAAITASLIACNSSGDKTEETKDTTSMNHDAHPATTATIEMPPMPEIPANARVYFANLKDGQKVTSPMKVEMAVENLKVDTANGILKPASGHHHILIDMDSIDTDTVITK